ncbi:hypothetical protein OSB04_un000624 [Centaurea solstitialis]|uniref:Reverse transcriptase Ty1/copia-type domain-containing protein n=1 Tax=Centaurea solstitialis TaxID=347529 RepID=A0AA38S5V8_9ASTR|nr:hypothetical protein OSB04_un000624 [Centaurea solstitialis]
MTILLKSHGLYSYVTGTTVAPTRTANESAIDYAKRVNEWDINNAKFLGFINASTTAEINQQFLGYTTAKGLWDFLTKRYSSTGLAHQYQLRTTASGSILLLLYVDDMIITGDDAIGIASLKQSLSSSFEMKDVGKLHYFLGLEVLSDSSGTYLCQAKYISDLLSKAALSDNKVASTPLEHNLHLAPNSGPPLQDPTRYRQLVGSLVYLTVTRPDIAYVVHTVSQFMAAPCSDHYAAVIRILRYLKGTMFHGLHFSSKSSLVLRGFSDSD